MQQNEKNDIQKNHYQYVGPPLWLKQLVYAFTTKTLNDS